MTPRDYRGHRNPRAKLTEADAREIMTSAETYEALAQRFNIHPTYVWKIRTKKNWKHLDDA